MPLETPRLDDRAFADIVAEARQRIALYCPEWTDHNLSDPGMTLIELFAWMTDIILYRMNRVPDKQYVKFMELIGMRPMEAEPARAPITFWFTTPQPTSVFIPAGTQVATLRTENDPAIVFSTDAPMEIMVPDLKYLLTSGGGQTDGRRFTTRDVTAATIGFEGFPVFESRPPRPGDSLYLGFEQNLSHHILGIELQVDVAEGAGIDPNNPPYVWETLVAGSDQNWVPIEVDADTTLGMNVTGMMRLHLPAIRRAVRNDITGYWIRLRLDPKDAKNYGVSPIIRKLVVQSWGGTTDATNVTTVTNRVLGRSDGSPGQRFYLDNAPIVTRTANEYILVRMEDGREERWTEVSDFATSGTDERHYTVDSTSGEVRFGPALPQRDGTVRRYGAIPPKGALILMKMYRYGGGTIGNVAARTLNVLKNSISYIERVSNRQPASGGMNAEDLNHLKLRVPGYLRSLNRAVTAADFETLAMEVAPGRIGRVQCLQPPATARGEIRVLVIPVIPRMQQFIAPESLNLSAELRDAIQEYLDERRLLSTQLSVAAPAYQWVQTEVRFRPNRNAQPETVREAVEARLFSFLNPLIGGPDGTGWPFGRDLFVSDIMAALLAVPGVDFVRSVKLFPVTYANGQFMRGEEVVELPVVTHGVVVSFRHDVRAE